jgi:DNA-binding ferritin-like protein
MILLFARFFTTFYNYLISLTNQQVGVYLDSPLNDFYNQIDTIINSAFKLQYSAQSLNDWYSKNNRIVFTDKQLTTFREFVTNIQTDLSTLMKDFNQMYTLLENPI